MQINLLSLIAERLDSAAPAAELDERPDVREDAYFDQVFEDKLSEMAPKEANEAPEPELRAAFLQRLSKVSHEAEAEDSSLSKERIKALSQLLGVDESVLESNSAISAEQLLPHMSVEQQRALSDFISALQELADLGQKMHQLGLSLVEAQNPNLGDVAQGDSLSTASVLTLLSNDAEVSEVQPLELSSDTIAALAALFQMSEEELSHNIAQIQLVDIQAIESLNFEGFPLIDMNAFSKDLEDQATAPGLVQLIASVLNKPVEEVWEQMEILTGDESEIPLGFVLASIVQPQTDAPLQGGFNLNSMVAREGNKIASLPLSKDAHFGDVPELAGRKVLGDLVLPNITQPADAEAAANASPLKFMPSHRQQAMTGGEHVAALAGLANTSAVKAEGVAGRKGDNIANLASMGKASAEEPSRQISTAIFQARTAKVSNPVPIRESAMSPLLRDSLDRPALQQAPVDSASSLALTASDSKLDFDSKLREARSTSARNAANPNTVREQVMVQVKQGVARGDSQINIRLNPAELGRVDVRMEVNADGRTTVAIVTDSRDTLEMLQRDSRSLEKAFSDLGMEMSDSGMSFDLNEQSSDQQEDESSKEDTKTASSNFDAMLPSPDEMIIEALLDGESVNYSVGVDDGLNIKV